MYRDLKPENILYSNDGTVKLADFGCVRNLRYREEDDEQVLSDYISTRWYRAPELLLGKNYYNDDGEFISMEYDFAVDIWALGCMMVGYCFIHLSCTWFVPNNLLEWQNQPYGCELKFRLVWFKSDYVFE